MSHFMIPAHVFRGKSALEEAVPYMRKLGNRALIVTGRHVGKSPMMDSLKKCLKDAQIAWFVFDGITGEPTDQMIAEGAALYKKTNSRFLIGIGGGSPLDAAKAIAAVSAHGGSVCALNGIEITGALPKVVAIPTTAGTGSEATRFTVITDREQNIKMLLKGECLVPEIAILNPEFTMDMPKSVTASTGLDALTHAVEAYTSKMADALTDLYATSAVKRIMKYLPAAYQNGFDGTAREEMALAAFEAGVCINNSSVTLVHGMSRPIGALFHVPHGLSNAMLLAECLEFALDGAYERFAALAKGIGATPREMEAPEAAMAFVMKIRELCKICEIPSLQEYGVSREAFEAAVEKMADDAIASGSPANTRKAVGKADCVRLYHRVFENGI